MLKYYMFMTVWDMRVPYTELMYCAEHVTIRISNIFQPEKQQFYNVKCPKVSQGRLFLVIILLRFYDKKTTIMSTRRISLYIVIVTTPHIWKNALCNLVIPPFSTTPFLNNTNCKLETCRESINSFGDINLKETTQYLSQKGQIRNLLQTSEVVCIY